MGSSDSNCCGSRIDKSYYIPDDPDSGTIGKKRRFQNIDSTETDTTTSVCHDKQTHSIEFRGNITFSSNIADFNSLPYGITFNINGQNINTNNANMMSTNMMNANINDTNKKSGDGLIDGNETQKPPKPEKQQKQQRKDVKPSIMNAINYADLIENNFRENHKDDNDYKDTLEHIDCDDNDNDDEEDDDLESISSLSNENEGSEENTDKEYIENDKYDLDNMQTLQLKENKGSNLLNPDEIENWNKKEIDQLEIEMLRELRRLSITSINNT